MNFAYLLTVLFAAAASAAPQVAVVNGRQVTGVVGQQGAIVVGRQVTAVVGHQGAVVNGQQVKVVTLQGFRSTSAITSPQYFGVIYASNQCGGCNTWGANFDYYGCAPQWGSTTYGKCCVRGQEAQRRVCGQEGACCADCTVSYSA